MKEKCNQTLAIIKERKTVNLEKSIPLLMEAYTKEIHTLPEIKFTEKEKFRVNKFEKKYLSTFKLMTTGPSHKVLKTIINNEPVLQKRNISLYYENNNKGIATSIFSIITLKNKYMQLHDGAKLHILHHELQHQRNGINHNRTTQALLNHKCFLADLQQNSYVRSILKQNIKNSQGHTLQDLLTKNEFNLSREISRYEEFRADKKAIEAMHCPHCVQEASINSLKYRRYLPDGYINRWQFQPRIDQLKKQGTICQHHHENGEKIDTLICDGSTLVKRLQIIQKK